MLHMLYAAFVFIFAHQGLLTAAARNDDKPSIEALRLGEEEAALSEALAGAAANASAGLGWGWEKMHLGHAFELVEEVGSGMFFKAFRVKPKPAMKGLKEGAVYTVKGWTRVGTDTPLHVEQNEQPLVASARKKARAECAVANDLHSKHQDHEGAKYFPNCLGSLVPEVPSGRVDTEVDVIMLEDVEPVPAGESKVPWPDFVKTEDAVQVAKVFVDIMEQCLQALAFLAERDYSHHDLRLENLVLWVWKVNGEWKPVVRIIDYGNMLNLDRVTKNKRDDRGRFMNMDDANMLDTRTRSMRFEGAPPEYVADNSVVRDAAKGVFWSWDVYMMGSVFVDLLLGVSWTVMVPFALKMWYTFDSQGFLDRYTQHPNEQEAVAAGDEQEYQQNAETLKHLITQDIHGTNKDAGALRMLLRCLFTVLECGGKTLPGNYITHLVGFMAHGGYDLQLSTGQEAVRQHKTTHQQFNFGAMLTSQKGGSTVPTSKDPRPPPLYTSSWLRLDNVRAQGHSVRFVALKTIGRMLSFDPKVRGHPTELLEGMQDLKNVIAQVEAEKASEQAAGAPVKKIKTVLK